MLLSEFIALDDWIDAMEDRFGLISKLQALQAVLQSNVKGKNDQNQPQPAQPFTSKKDAAAEAMAAISLSGLTNAQIVCLSVHDANQCFGEEASQNFLAEFRDAASDPSHLLSHVQKIYRALTQARSGIKNSAKGVRKYGETLSSDEYVSVEPRLSIIFKGETSVSKLSDLRDAAGEWHKIISSIGIALDVPVDDFKILGARNGSFIVDLYLAAAAIVPIGFILVRSLTLLERFATSMRKIHDIVKLNSDDERLLEIEKDVQALTDKYFTVSKKIGAEDIAKEVIEQARIPEDKKGEADAHIRRVVKKMLGHLKNGGGLDVFLPTDYNSDVDGESDINQSDVEKASGLFEEFRGILLDTKDDLPKLLEGFNFDDDDQEES